MALILCFLEKVPVMNNSGNYVNNLHTTHCEFRA